ncbi:MAG: adenosylcobinamide amidohydrolase [Saccharospirillaceae bacterium]|nr:adenosylcobinamide amidohydrolase [Saccharospirillaceae bacterium]MCD8531408.1 adenosylcobinamide amidohydrolase [Saccharospirillaceae bacterium]
MSLFKQDNQGGIRVEHSDTHIALTLPEPWLVLSSAVLNGGFSSIRSLLNLRVDQHAPPPWPPAEHTLQQQAEQRRLPMPCCGMMTAASMRSLGYSTLTLQSLTAECWVTAGLSNLRRSGDPADAFNGAGTINIWLLLHAALTPAAMAEALIQLTEAKVTAIRDAGLLSPLSKRPASGTGTDSHAVICPPDSAAENALAFCGKHTIAGELIGRVVLDACKQSIGHCLQATAERP